MTAHFDGTMPAEWAAAMTLVGRSIAATVGDRVPRDEDDLRLADELDIEELCDGDAAHWGMRKWWRL